MPVVGSKLDFVAMRKTIPAASALNLDFSDGSITYTGIDGKSVDIQQTFNYVQIFNEDAVNDLFVCIHPGTTVNPTAEYGTIRIPPYGGFERKLSDIRWLSMRSSVDLTAQIILEKGGLV